MSQRTTAHSRTALLPAASVGGSSVDALDTVLAYIQQHLGDPLPLRRLAEVAKLSLWRFSTVFRLNVGVSPHRYINLQRVRRAQALLREGVPVARTACACGFYDQSHLSRCFKRICGMTPRQYQLAARGPMAACP